MPAASSECRTASLVHCFGLEHLALPALFYDCLDVGIGEDGYFLPQAAGLGRCGVVRDNGAR